VIRAAPETPQLTADRLRMPRRNPRMAVNRRRGVVQPPVCSIDQDRGRDQGTDELAEDRCWGQVQGQQERGEASWRFSPRQLASSRDFEPRRLSR
jgi:hypothetical protein